MHEVHCERSYIICIFFLDTYVLFIFLQISKAMKEKKLTLVGWYHSHPISEPKPSHSDIISQKEYQELVRRSTGEEPSIGIIIS